MKTFLIKAKKATYAGNGKKKRIRGGWKELEYKEGGLVYRDRYRGERTFSGEEVVFKNGKPIWHMSYSGTCKKLLLMKKIYDFLKKALLKIPKDAPFRGPGLHEEGGFRYENNWSGDLKGFKGKEEIYYKGKLVYDGEYSGGREK